MSSPFKDSVGKYRGKGWGGTLPLPANKKESPPTGFTGKKAEHPSVEELKAWMAETKYENGNICLRLGRIGETEWEVIGIDVDHYESGGKEKLGGDQLEELESKFGKLPNTWISTARTDGISGIRMYRIPRGLGCKGKAAADVDLVSLGYRYAVVCPSIHPNGNMYQWYPDCKNPDGQVKGLDGIPNPMELPILPDPWIDYVTGGRMPFTIDEIDMEYQGSAAIDWATENFPEIHDMCFRMRQKLNLHKRKIKADPSSHDKMRDAHWNLTRLAAEGHYGWDAAIREINNFYADDVINREKRGNSELGGEIKRSITNAVRKIKLQIDDAGGIPPNDPECCMNTLRDVDGYDTTHDGNGEHFYHLKQIDGEPTMYYIKDWKKWIVWKPDKEDSTTGRWIVDEEDGGLIRREWLDVKQRQKDFVEKLRNDMELQIAAVLQVNPDAPTRGRAKGVAQNIVDARDKFVKWDRFVEKSGDNYHAGESIRNAGKRWLTITSDELNWDRNLIACSNGVIEFDRRNKTIIFRKQRMDDLITMNIGIDWNPKKDTESFRMWTQFLDKFIPKADIQRMIQIALGYTLLDGNQERVFMIALGQTSTGKSTFVRLCGKALGDYAAPVGKTIFQNHKFKPSLILNARKTLIYTTEFDSNTTMSTAMVKEITGGSDEIEVERKGVDEVAINDLNCVPLLASNQMPNLTEPDLAVKRRLYILPFDEIISKLAEDKKFSTMMEKVGLEAVFFWLIEGLKMYMENGENLIHNEYTDGLVNDAVVETGDPVVAFVDDCLEFHEHHDNFKIDESVWTKDRPEWTIDGSICYQHFKAWWFDNDFQPRDLPSAKAFTIRLRALGMRKPKKNLWVNGRDGKYWLGVKFKPGAKIFTIPNMTLKTRTN